MKNIHIGGHEAGTAQSFLRAHPREYDCLVITNPGTTVPEEVKQLARETLHLSFHDIVYPFEDHRLPDLASVRRALDWADERDRLLVACHAGLSRSAALAYLIACTERPPPEALSVLDRDVHIPNELIVRLGATLLDNPLVWETFRSWCRIHRILGQESSADEDE